MASASENNTEAAITLALETINIQKQAIVFANTRLSAEKTAEEIAKKIKQSNQENLAELEYEVLHALSTSTKQCKRLAFCIKKGIAFHHAGLAPAQRSLIEDSFRNGDIKVICCTPTLAYGLDIPAFRVIIRDLKRFTYRGMQYIPVLEYLQMSGRAGRPKYDNYGESIAIANTEKIKDEIEETYLKGKPETIYSKLAAEPVLRTYILSLIASEFVGTKDQLFNFFSKTFWAHHYRDMWQLQKIIDKMMDLLEEWEFIKTDKKDFMSADEDYKINTTKLGKRVAELYIDPLTANFFITCLRNASSKKPEDFSYFQMISNTLELRPLLRVKRKDVDFVELALVRHEDVLLEDTDVYESEYNDEYSTFMASIKTALFFKDWVNEKDEEFLLEKFDIKPGEIASKLERGNWLLYTATELSKLLHFKELITDMIKLRLRLKYGSKEELLPLLKFKNIGRVRARKLFNNNIKDVSGVKKADFMKLSQLLGNNTAVNIKKQVGQDFTKLKVKKGKRKGQMSLKKYS